MPEHQRPKQEIIPGMRVRINQLSGISGLKIKFFQVKICSEGVVNKVFVATGHSLILFDPTKKTRERFLLQVPTICLSAK